MDRRERRDCKVSLASQVSTYSVIVYDRVCVCVWHSFVKGSMCFYANMRGNLSFYLDN